MAYKTNDVGTPPFPPASTRAFRSTRVVTPDGVRPATVVVQNDSITELGSWKNISTAGSLHDYGDLVLMPGLVDTHVHINEAGPEPGRTHWEGFATATRAAAAGGVTALVDMPLNCVPETIS